MDIHVNSTAVTVAEGSNLSDALVSINLAASQGIAIAINNQVIPKSLWPSHLLCDGDKVTIIKATQGG